MLHEQGQVSERRTAEQQALREWLDDILEDELEFTPEFEAAIKRSEQDMSHGERPRVRKP